MDTEMKLIEILMWPIEAWVECWQWFGELDTRKDTLGAVLTWVLRFIWIAVTALFAFLWISLPLGL